MNNKTPYFLWDYNLDEKEIKRILKKGNQTSRRWLVGRILESARFKDIWHYLSLKEIKKIFPHLKLKKPIKKAWQRALNAWDD